MRTVSTGSPAFFQNSFPHIDALFPGLLPPLFPLHLVPSGSRDLIWKHLILATVMPLAFRSILLTSHEGKLLFEGADFFAQVLDLFLLGLALCPQGLALPVLGLALCFQGLHLPVSGFALRSQGLALPV